MLKGIIIENLNRVDLNATSRTRKEGFVVILKLSRFINMWHFVSHIKLIRSLRTTFYIRHNLFSKSNSLDGNFENKRKIYCGAQ